MGSEVAGIRLLPDFAVPNGLVGLDRDELVVGGRDVKLLPLARTVSEGESLPDCFVGKGDLP